MISGNLESGKDGIADDALHVQADALRPHAVVAGQIVAQGTPRDLKQARREARSSRSGLRN
jgi:hypothetical protein